MKRNTGVYPPSGVLPTHVWDLRTFSTPEKDFTLRNKEYVGKPK